LRKRGHVVDGKVAGGGAHVSLPTWRRSTPYRYHLVAGECPNCGKLTFPPEGACVHCHSIVEFTHRKLPDQGEIKAVTKISQGAPPEFNEQQLREGSFGVAIIEFELGAESVLVHGQLAEMGGESMTVGTDVEPTIRKFYEQEGVPRYGVKFTSHASDSGGSDSS
jgi:uncharacterized OB-fold protein